MPRNISSGANPMSTRATTLHVTLLTSHYNSAHDKEDATAVSNSSSGGAGHRRDAPQGTKANNSANVKSAGSEGADVYSCSTVADHLDTVARVLCAVFRLQNTAKDDAVAETVRRIQTAKAVRDDVMPWENVADATSLVQQQDSHLPGYASPLDYNANGGGPVLPFVSTVTTPSSRATTPPSSSSGVTKAKGRIPVSAKGGATGLSANMSPSSSSLLGLQDHTSDPVSDLRQQYVGRELPPCEVAVVPGASSASAESYVLFVYHLAHEEEVLAQLSALATEEISNSSEKKDILSSSIIDPPKGEKRSSHASRAAEMITQALWTTVQETLGAYLDVSGCRTAPTHVPVVWAMTDPRLMKVFLPCSSDDTDELFSFHPCPTSVPVRSSPLCRPAVMTSTERLVRLLPRSIFYLYDPSSSSTFVKETLSVFQPSSRERSHSQESSQSAVPGLSVNEGVRKTSSQRNGARPPTMPAAKSSRSAGLPPSGPGTSRGRGGRGAAGASGATATHASVLAASAPQRSSLQTRLLNMGVDMQAAPEDFPYCNCSPRILAQYLYSGGAAAVPPLSQVAAPVASSPTQADLEVELTCFLAKMAAFQRAVMAASEAGVTTSKTEEATEEMWCTHASLLRWVNTYLNCSSDVPLSDRSAARLMSCTDGDTRERRQQPPLSFEEVVRLSLSRCLPKDSVWPLPLWEIAPLPIAPVPPLILRSTGSSDIAASAHRTVENIIPWATTVLSTMVGEDKSGDGAEVTTKTPFVPLLSRIVHLIETYNAWSSKNSLTPARALNSACHKGGHQAVAGKAQGGQTEDAQSIVPPSMAPGRHTGGVFNIMSALCVWVAAVGASPAHLKPPGELTTLCASELWVPASNAKQPDCSRDAMAPPSLASSGLFRRYAQPFYVLQMAASRDEKTRIGTGALVAIVPRLATATEALESELADAQKRIKYAVPTAERIHHHNVDVALPPYPQEASWMVRHIIAKNAGHFEVNVARGTDTVTPAADRKGLCPTFQDLVAGGSSSIALHQSAIAAMTTTKSIGHLLQQQRRRLLWHMSGVAAKLQPYSQGVHLIKEMARDFLGRRPVMETSVTLQEALESTLAAPRPRTAADKKRIESQWTLSRRAAKASRGESADSGANATQQVSALNLLQRYLVSVDPTHARLATKSKLVKPQSPALLLERHRSNEINDNRLLAARAAAENLMPRIYEHVLQQALLHQLLRETGLELADRPAPPPNSGHLPTALTEDDASANDDWNITQQLPVQAIVTSIVDFQERFGAHNVAWRSCALHYRPLSLPTAKKDSVTGQEINVLEIPEEDADDEVLRTSAYAHNALNVHPTRRVTHIWIAGVTVPSAQVAQHSEGGCQSDSGMKQGPSKHITLGQQRSRRWVNMVPQAGTVTPVEVYALWQSLLREQLDNLASTANEKCTVTTIADSAAHLRVGPTDLKMRTMYSLISQYMQEHAEASTSLARAKETSSTFSEKINSTDISPMRFDTHETLYPYGDAIVEVWCSEVQRLCRYIKATEVVATLHAVPSNKGDPNVHLTVHWDDGLLLTCASGSGSQNNINMVPPIDVMLTTCNTVFQRREGVPRIRLYRFPNTSSTTMASATVSLKAMSGPPTPPLPQGGVMETCAALFEEPVILYCVHHCPPKMTASTVVELEGSSEHETMCEVDERTGVVHRFYASGMEQLLFPSGAIMIRRPVVAAFSKMSLCKPAPHYCDTLVTLDGRCFVRNGSGREDNFADASHKQSKGGDHGAVFQRVHARISRANCEHTKRAADGDDLHAPSFTRTESTYDAVYHCNMHSRQDGLTVAEYESLKPYTASEGTKYGDCACTMLARVVVFPDGTTITTVPPREVRRRALVRHTDGTSVLASLSSPTLCTLLEEVQAVEDSLLRSVGDGADLSVCWCVEAPSMPRVYLAPAQQESNKKEKVRIPSFAVVFGDGTVLQRRWVAAVMPPSPFCATADEGSPLVDTGKGDGAGGGDVGEIGARGTQPYSAGTFETVLTRPSITAVRILHQHAIATIEPADVLDAITYTSPAAYAVGQGLLFFDLACGGGLRLVDAARCVWEVRNLAAAHGPQVLHPDRANAYGELLRALVSPHYSPHRLPRAVQMTYAREQQHESATYAQKRATGWCPPLLRRMREIAEPFIRIAQLLRTDVLAPIESSAAAADKRLFRYGGALSTPPSANMTGGSCTKAQSDSSLAGVPPESMLRVFPVCFGQLDNGEAIRYRHVSEVPPLSSGSSESATPIAPSEPQVIERLVPGIETGSVLGYISTALGHTYNADAIGSLFSGQPNSTTGNSGVLWKRLVKIARLSLLCAGVLAPPIPPAIKPPSRASFLSSAPSSVADINASSVLSLPPLAVLLNRGSRWLPAALQPPQRFGIYQNKRSADSSAAEVDNADVAWVRDSPAALSNATLNTAYVEYVLQQVNPATAIKTSCAALQREVVRKELHRHEQLAQLSHYHRVLSTQWPMELPASAREEQVRLEMRFEELQRASSSGIPRTSERMAT